MKKLLLTLMACFAVISANAWTVYFTNPKQWSTPYIYAWNGNTSGDAYNSWPGTAMTKVPGTDNLWSYTYTAHTPADLLFTNGASSGTVQTVDYTFTDGDYYPTMYVIGSKVNGQNWALNTNPMTYNPTTNVYEWNGESLSSGFKLNDGGWDNDKNFNFGAQSDSNKANVITEDVPFKVVNGGSSKDIVFSDPNTAFENPKLTFNTGNLTVTLSGQTTELTPEVFIAGTFSDWANNKGDFELSTTDNNVFTGTYNIPADSQFKIVVNTQWYGAENDDAISVTPSSSPVTLNMNSGASDQQNWSLNGWNGGDITFTVNIKELTCTLEFGQEEAITYPDVVYLAGNFNEWSSDNDEYQLTSSEEGIYTGKFNIPETATYDGNTGAPEFKLVANTTWYGVEAATSSIELTSGTASNVTITNINGSNIYLQNWKGGEITFTLDWNTKTLSLLYTAPEPVTLYLVGDNINGSSAWNTNYPQISTDGIFTWNVDEFGSKFKITDNPTDWTGSYNIGTGSDDQYKTLIFGEAFTYLNDGNSNNIAFSQPEYHLNNATVTLNLNEGTLTVNGTQELNEITGVYLAGSFNGWEESLENDDYALSLENGVYTGKFNITSETDPEFKIVVKYGNVQSWFGANSDEASIELDGVNPVEDLNLVNGENFTLVGFSEGEVTFTVNTEDMTLSVLYVAPQIDEPETIYILGDDLNGEEVWTASETNLMTYNEGEGTYTWTGSKLGSKFKFNNGSWNEGFNIGAENEVNELTLGEPFTLVNNGDAKNILLTPDTYIENPVVVLDLEALTVTVTGTVVETAPFAPGEVIYFKTSLDWENGYELAKNEDGIYTAEIEIPAVTDTNDVEFKLDCGENHWYGATSEQANVELTEDVAISLDLDANGSNWTLVNWQGGVLNVSVDWTAGVLTLEKVEGETDGINSINTYLNEDDAIYTLQGVRVNNTNLRKGIYIINGKKVLVK